MLQNRAFRLLNTSIGRKLLMALTGIALMGFLTTHLLGNLTAFYGQDAMNAYAHWLKSHPALWGARLGLLGLFSAHVFLALMLFHGNKRARPIGYRMVTPQQSTVMSRHMVLTGSVVLAFVVFHLLHFTLHNIDPSFANMVDPQGRHDVYNMVVLGFEKTWIAAGYMAAMAMLGLHLFHGAKSLFQTLGVNHESYNDLVHYGCAVLVTLHVIGFCAIPVAVQAGALQPVTGGN